MDDEFQTQLIADLKHSGFYSEMVAILTCIAEEWECHGGSTYFDKDARATRECDLEAVVRFDHVSRVRLSMRLLAQVKKSERPWIVFKDPTRPDAVDPRQNVFHALNLGAMESGVRRALAETSLGAVNGWSATGIHEGFKKPTDKSSWYAAFVGACKAAESAYDAVVTITDFLTDDCHFDLVKPVVILDGKLLSAEIDDEQELKLMEIESAAFRFEYRSEVYQRSHYAVDLVTLTAFPRYLRRARARMQSVLELFTELDR